MLLKKNNPCSQCIVKACCTRKCDNLKEWERRWDWIKKPFLFSLLIPAIFALGVGGGVLAVLLKKEKNLEDYNY